MILQTESSWFTYFASARVRRPVHDDQAREEASLSRQSAFKISENVETKISFGRTEYP